MEWDETGHDKAHRARTDGSMRAQEGGVRRGGPTPLEAIQSIRQSAGGYEAMARWQRPFRGHRRKKGRLTFDSFVYILSRRHHRDGAVVHVPRLVVVVVVATCALRKRAHRRGRRRRRWTGSIGSGGGGYCTSCAPCQVRPSGAALSRTRTTSSITPRYLGQDRPRDIDQTKIFPAISPRSENGRGILQQQPDRDRIPGRLPETCIPAFS